MIATITALITSNLSTILAWGAGAFGVVATLFMVRKSGSDAAKAEAKTKDAENADIIRKDGAQARADAGAAAAGDGLRSDDGFRR